MKQNKFIIVIPTRNRADVLEWSLKTCLTQDYDNLEIIISDNYSEDNTKDLISSINDHRVKYVNPGKRLSMSHNWEYGLSFAKGGFVTILGDDDGILPNAISQINSLLNKNPSQAICWHQSNYFWPNNPFHKHELYVLMRKGIVTLNGPENFKAVVSYDKFYTSNPWLYAGFVHTDIIERIKAKGNGSFFHSMIPDVYSGLAIATQVNSYLYSTGSFSIAATSSHSNGAAQFSSKKELQKNWNTFLTEAQPIPFHSSLEFISSSFAILIAESAMQVYDAGLVTDKDIIPDLETVLMAALKEANGKDPEVREKELIGIEGIAHKHQISLKKIGFSKTSNKQKKHSTFLRHLRKRAQGIYIDGDAAGLKNIYDATLLHDKLYNSGSRIIYNAIRKVSELVNGK